MDSPPAPDCTHLSTALSEHPTLWKSADVRVLACGGSARWENLYTTITLTSKPASEIPLVPYLPVLRHIGCWQQVFEIGDTERLERGILDGVLRVCGEEVSFGKSPLARANNRAYTLGRNASGDLFRKGWMVSGFRSGYECMFVGPPMDAVLELVPGGLETITKELRRAEYPWPSVEVLMEAGLGTYDRVEHSRACIAEIWAPIEATLSHHDCKVDATKLTIVAVSVAEEVLRGCSLAAFALDDHNNPRIWSGSLAEAPCFETQDGYAIRVELNWDPAPTTTVMLRGWGLPIDMRVLTNRTLGGTNLRLEAYASLVDPSLEALSHGLSPAPGGEQVRFEHSVSRLLAIAGFTTVSLAGDKRLGEGPDAIAFTADEDILLVECTTSTPTSDKVSKLRSRSARLNSALGSEVAVKLVLASSVPRAEGVGIDVVKNATDVAFLWQEDLQEIFRLASNSAAQSDLLALMESRKGGEKQNQGLLGLFSSP
jgi:hypothetical protein